jgi:cytochrome c oxidase subunit II
MAAEDPRRRSAAVRIAPMIVIGVIVSVCGIALGLLIDWFPVAASKEAKDIDTLWDVLIICSVPVFVLVETVVLYSVWKFRMRPGEELEDGPPIHGNTRLEVVWTAVPAILLVALCSYAYIVLHDIEQAPAAGNEMKVRVVGQQFTWIFYYPGENGGKEIASPELYLPESTPVKFTIQSRDVIHDFWVPAFRQKIDAVPGINTSYRITTTHVKGSFPVVCAELCGLGHSTMRQTAHVVSKADFDSWLQKLRSGSSAQGGGGSQGGGGGGSSSADDGKTLFTSTAQPAACGSCHTLADAGTSGTTGPNLDDVLKGKDAAFIKQSIEDPDAEVADGFSKGIMPKFGDSLEADQVDALVKYLSDVAGK